MNCLIKPDNIQTMIHCAQPPAIFLFLEVKEMKKFKKALCLVLALTMIFALAACGGGKDPGTSSGGGAAAGGEKKEYTITVATAYNDDHYMVAGYNAFKEYVEKESGGRIKVDIFANGTLVTGDSDTLEYVSSGSYTMGNSDLTMIGSFITDNRWESTSIPLYYGNNLDKVYDVLDNSDAWKELYADLAEKGNLVVLGSVNGGVAVIGSDVPVRGMGDFAGKKYRTATSDPYLKPVEAWGASAVAMAFSEIYTSVQNKTINGTFTSMSAIYTQGLTDVMKYIIRVDGFNLLFGFLMNEDFYASLDAEAKKIVDEGGKKCAEAARAAEKAFSEELDGLLVDEGVEQIVPDAAWKAELEKAVEAYVKQRCDELDQAWLAKLNKALGK